MDSRKLDIDTLPGFEDGYIIAHPLDLRGLPTLVQLSPNALSIRRLPHMSFRLGWFTAAESAFPPHYYAATYTSLCGITGEWIDYPAPMPIPYLGTFYADII